MEQRPLRLGDIVDDYCPRERRITNHAILAMTGDQIHSTRCATCESEHPYKRAKLPLRRAKNVQENAGVHLIKGVQETESVHLDQSVHATQSVEPSVTSEPSGSSEPSESNEPSGSSEPEVSWNRPLIRAALPKGVLPNVPRPLPDFTMRSIRGRRDQQPGRWNGGGNGNGNGNGRRHSR